MSPHRSLVQLPLRYNYFYDQVGFTIGKDSKIKKGTLDHSETYLGPNYKEVLNYWFYWGSWSREQRGIYRERYWALDYETRKKARKTTEELVSEVIDSIFARFLSDIELELIAAHLFIEREIPFTFLPLLFDL